MKKKIVFLCLSLVLVAGLLSASSVYAWFVASSGGGGSGSAPAGDHLLSSGNMGYTLCGNFKLPAEGEKIVPEDELLAAFTGTDLADVQDAFGNTTACKMYLTNTSTIQTQLRIRIEYGYNSATAVYDGSETSPLTVNFTNSALWDYESGYFYYGTYVVENSTAESDELAAYVAGDGVEPAVPQAIPLFNSVRYSGKDAESDAISGQNVTVSVTFEARQSKFVDWFAIGTIYSRPTVTP